MDIKHELKDLGLIETEDTIQASLISKIKVYAVEDEEDLLISRYDFSRSKHLPHGILALTKTVERGMFTIHLNEKMLLDKQKKYLHWAIEMLRIQIFLKAELDD